MQKKGPIIACLYQRFGGSHRRLLVTTGSVLAAGGLIVASQVAGKIGFSLCLAAAGLGSNIILICVVIALNDQTTGSWFGILYGIGKSGYAFGMTIVPLAAAYLMDIYGWSGSLMAIGGIMAHLIPLTLMVKVNGVAGNEVTDEQHDIVTDARWDRRNDKNVHGHIGKEYKGRGCRRNLIDQSQLPTDDKVVVGSGVALLAKDLSGNEYSRTPYPNENACNVFDQTFEDKKGNNMDSGHSRIQHHHNEKNTRKSFHPYEGNAIFNYFWCYIKTSIFNKDRWLILLVIIYFEFAMMDAGWHAFLVPRAVDRGWSNREALNFAYSGAVAAFIGRCFGGVILRLRLLSGLSWFLLLTLINVVSLTADILIQNFALVIVTSFITSLTIAERNILVLVICKDRVSHSEFPVILATLEVVFGIGAFIGVSLSGFVGDLYHTFNASFMFIAAVDTVVFCLTTPLLIFNRPADEKNR